MIVFPVLLGLAIARWTLPAVFPYIPNDLMRTKAILAALAEREPSGVAFGNSIVMNGVDARRLSKLMDTKSRVETGEYLNLASTGQTPAESYLYYQLLAPSTRLVIQFLTPEALERSQPFNRDVFNAFFMYGYRPTPHTTISVATAFGAESGRLLRHSASWQAFESRWVVRQAIDTGVRGLLRSDLDLDRFYTDLYFPSPYTRKVSSEALEGLFEHWRAAREVAEFRAASTQLRMIGIMSSDALSGGRRMVFVLAPVHPWKRRVLGASYLNDYREVVQEAAGAGAELLDASSLLAAEEFVDDVHPTRDGAARLTAWLATNLERRH